MSPAIACATHSSPLGELIALADGEGRLIQLHFADMDRPPPACPSDRRLFASLFKQLDAYFAGDLCSFEVDTAAAGSGFQRRVWSALQEIPFGQTRSYGETAEAIGRPGAARAAGSACRLNPIAIVVPCHRVISASGSLTGYAGGLQRKRFLLEHERSLPRSERRAGAQPAG